MNKIEEIKAKAKNRISKRLFEDLVALAGELNVPVKDLFVSITTEHYDSISLEMKGAKDGDSTTMFNVDFEVKNEYKVKKWEKLQEESNLLKC